MSTGVEHGPKKNRSVRKFAKSIFRNVAWREKCSWRIVRENGNNEEEEEEEKEERRRRKRAGNHEETECNLIGTRGVEREEGGNKREARRGAIVLQCC